MTRRKRYLNPIGITATVVIAAASFITTQDVAHADDPAKLLKAMSDYLASNKSLAAKFDSSIEVVTLDLQKIQFTSSGEIKLSRPDKLRIRRTGGYADVDLVYDGKTVSLYGNNTKFYVQVDLAGTIDNMIDAMQSQSSVGIPGADLLLSNSYDQLMAGVIEGKHIGQGVVDGVECEHLSFRDPDTDWQIWIEAGAKPVPRKYVITSKTVSGAPQYTLSIREWKTDANADSDFVFKAPGDATKVALDSAVMVELDEIPPGVPEGAKK